MKHLVLVMSVLTTACSHGWIVRQQSPTSLAGKTFTLFTADFSTITIHDRVEADYLDADAKRRWRDVEMGIGEELAAAALRYSKGVRLVRDGAVTVHPRIETVNPGCDERHCSSEITMVVQLLDERGALLDEVFFRRSHRGESFLEPTDERRLRHDAEDLGKELGKYLSNRGAP